MAPTTFQDRVATEERMLEHLNGNERELEARGLHVPLWRAQLEAALAAVKEKDRRQEALKAELKASTADLEVADVAAYRLCSGLIDATAAAWGKGSAQADVLLRMRSKVHIANEPAGTIQPEPLPPK